MFPLETFINCQTVCALWVVQLYEVDENNAVSY
jgi:hypothetical protein